MTKEERSLTCPICGGTEFTRENGRIFKTTFTATKVTLMICKECHHVMTFSTGKHKAQYI